MTLMTGLRHDERLAGLVGLSGYLPLAAKTEAERHDANRDAPIFLAHGTGDPMIPIARARQSRDALVALGHPVEWHEYPMPHSVCAAEIADLNAGCCACWPDGSARSARDDACCRDADQRAVDRRRRRLRGRSACGDVARAVGRRERRPSTRNAHGLQNRRGHRRGHDQHDEQARRDEANET